MHRGSLRNNASNGQKPKIGARPSKCKAIPNEKKKKNGHIYLCNYRMSNKGRQGITFFIRFKFLKEIELSILRYNTLKTK